MEHRSPPPACRARWKPTAGAAATPTHANEPAMSARTRAARLGIDAALGIRPSSADDQSKALQRAIDETARTRRRWRLRPASTASAIISCRRARTSSACAARPSFVLTDGPSLRLGRRRRHVTLSGLASRRRRRRAARAARARASRECPRRQDRRLRDRERRRQRHPLRRGRGRGHRQRRHRRDRVPPSSRSMRAGS